MTAKIIPFPQVRRIMSDERWEDELKRIKRRMERIAMAQLGKADVQRVKVKECWVPRHKRGGHTRLVITLRDQKIKRVR